MNPIKKRKVLIQLASNLAIVLIGAILVLGFYYHQYFYDFGLPLLLLVGALLVFLIIRVTQWLGGERFDASGEGFILFTSDEVEAVLSGVKRQTIRLKRDDNRYRVGSFYDAKVGVTSERKFAIIRISGVVEKTLDELTDEDIRREGFSCRSEYKKRWKGRHGSWDGKTPVQVIRFRVEDNK